jgi:hypothetical protein
MTAKDTADQTLALIRDHDETLGSLKEHLVSIDVNTACLPALCQEVARHDEKLKGTSISVGRLWTVMIALIVAIVGGSLGIISVLLGALIKAGGKL